MNIPMMFTASANEQILWSVIAFNSVDVVDTLATLNRSSKHLLSNCDVLKDRFGRLPWYGPGEPNDPIPTLAEVRISISVPGPGFNSEDPGPVGALREKSAKFLSH